MSSLGIFGVGIVHVRVILGGNFPSRDFPGGSYPWWEFSRRELSTWELSGGNHPGGSFAGVSFHVTRLTDTYCQEFSLFWYCSSSG